ncbi:carboxypeptidase-like regulatory domain-containing protein [uncultured Mucilaginibacter sp.]|uniref:carboxypeptidase-like regulatory domain-containing protein n=1 Tax=uncultured Mucilaginibacter sp. TaxID=797541 RepID=UPI0026247669|nr:carboxypeptidase-like regulatory domain-containing protein [uncultured Mucilaginibacter sp.]
MKKQAFFIQIFFLLLSSLTFAQTITVSGTIKNEAGNALPAAMVEVKSTPTVLRVDSAGEFSMGVNPKAKLLVSCPGYEDKQVNVNNNTDLKVVLVAKLGTNINNNQAGTGSNNQFANGITQRQGAATSLIYGNSGARIGSLLPVFGHTEATRGSRYLFDEWTDGTVLSVKDSVIKNPNYHFNYDKINGILLLSENKTNAIEIDKGQVKAFTLHKDGGRFETFELVPEIDQTHFVEVLSNGKKYKIYKQLNTKFIKNNYRTDGMTSSGNNYDEYVDESTYYVMDVKTQQLRKITLKKKALKEAFAADAVKVNTYLITNTDDINDSYVANLGNYLNQ